MTKFDLNGIIDMLQNKKNNGFVKFKMEGYLEQSDISLVQDGKLLLICSQQNKMAVLEKKFVNLTDATNYLIQLFYKSGKKYSCTRTKIGKLLSIVAFKYACEGVQVFRESICKYEDCGTTINELKTFLERDIYRCESYENSMQPVDMNCLTDYDDEIKEAGYQDIGSLSKEAKDRIDQVFSVFGAYTPRQLGEALCDLISLDGVILETDEISLTRIKELSEFDFQSQRGNANSNFAVIDFLFSHA